jgi:NADPH-dependent 2,4-dienoyl-CoA reductase/sulfur reductase-like enzyme
MKLLIDGGVAGGAPAATRARRLSEDAQIVLFERGPDVSFANCGLPYHICGEISKLLFDPNTAKVLGAQAVGGAGVDRRIDVLAMAIQAGMTVFDLEEVELAYAPQYGSAKDPINMAGFVAAGLLPGDHPISMWKPSSTH